MYEISTPPVLNQDTIITEDNKKEKDKEKDGISAQEEKDKLFLEWWRLLQQIAAGIAVLKEK